MPHWSEYINMFVTLLAIVDPWGAVPVFIGIAHKQSAREQKRLALLAAFTVGMVLIGSALLGERLLLFFGISIDSFRVAGGLLLLLIGINMLHSQKGYGQPLAQKHVCLEDKEEMAVVPLAIPLLSGPGAISSMTIYAHNHAQWTHLGMLIVISLLVALVTWITLWMAQPIGKMLGKAGMSITIRLMGLLLSAAAVQFIANGLARLFPGLAH